MMSNMPSTGGTASTCEPGTSSSRFTPPPSTALAATREVDRLDAIPTPSASSYGYVYTNKLTYGMLEGGAPTVTNSNFKHFSSGAYTWCGVWSYNRLTCIADIPAGTERTFSNVASYKFKNAGKASDGRSVDLILTLTSATIRGRSAAAGASSNLDLNYTVFDFDSASSSGLPRFVAWQHSISSPSVITNAGPGARDPFYVGVKTTWTYSFVYSDTSGAVPSNMKWKCDFFDLDYGDRGCNPNIGSDEIFNYSRPYRESITFNSGFENTKYVVRNTYLRNEGNCYFGSREDKNNSQYSGVSAWMTASNGSVTWTGSLCGTNLNASGIGAGYSPHIPAPAPSSPIKSVSSVWAPLTQAPPIFDIVQNIPLTDSTAHYGSISIEDVLDPIFDATVAPSVRVYRASASSSSYQDDTANWNISFNASQRKVTASHKSPSSASGTYKVSISPSWSASVSEAIKSYAIKQFTHNGAQQSGHAIPNTASSTIDNRTQYTNSVEIYVPKVQVRYHFVGIVPPDHSPLPPNALIDYGSVYTETFGPATTTADKYVFDGWYDSDPTVASTAKKFTSSPLTSDLDLYGVWKHPDILLEKSLVESSPIKEAMSGDVVHYTLKVTNTGNTVLHDIAIDDSLPVSFDASLIPDSLAAGNSFTLTASYILTQSDIDAGHISNTATVSATDENNIEVDSTDDAQGDIEQNPSISLQKTSDHKKMERAFAGDAIVYKFTVENTGNVTLLNMFIDDGKLSDSPIPVSGTLAPGQKTSVEYRYLLTQEDIDAGEVVNHAIVRGTSPSKEEVTDDDDNIVGVVPFPEITLSKSVVGDKVIENAHAGDKVTYRLVALNSGNTTLTGITFDDVLPGVSISPRKFAEPLAPRQEATATAEYILTQQDIDRGSVHNIATVQGTSPKGETVEDDDDEDIETPSNPSLSVDKVADIKEIASARPGDKITYTFTVTNTGNTTVSDIALNDEKLGGNIDLSECEHILPPTLSESSASNVLAPNEKLMVKAEHLVTQEDIDRGYVPNTAIASGKDPNGTDVSGEDEEKVLLEQQPKIILVKTAIYRSDNTPSKVGETVRYSFIIANTGNTTLLDVELNDEKLGGNIDLVGAQKKSISAEDIVLLSADKKAASWDKLSLGDPMSSDTSVLAPGEAMLVEVDYALTQEDLDAGKVTNVAETSGHTPNRDDITDSDEGVDPNISVRDEDTAEVHLISTPSMSLVKSAIEKIAFGAHAGDIVEWKILVTNTGNTTLRNIEIHDDLEGVAIDIASIPEALAPGDAVEVRATYALSDDDLRAHKVDNHAWGVADDLIGNKVSADDTETIEVIPYWEVADELISATGSDVLPIGMTVVGIATLIAAIAYRRTRTHRA